MINPTFPVKTVFVFPIHNEVRTGKSVYDATRYAWKINAKYLSRHPSFAVGLEKSISIGSFEIQSWIPATDLPNKNEFLSPNHPNPIMYSPLFNQDWSKIISHVEGYWRFGNYLIVEFDGNGHFRIERGNPDHRTWHECI